MIEFDDNDEDMEVMDSNATGDDLTEDNDQTNQIVQLNTSIVLSYYHCIRLDANTELEMILNNRNSRRGSSNSIVETIDGSDEETNLHQGDGPTNSQSPSLKFNSNIRNIAESNPEIYFLILSGECQSFGTKLIPKNLYRLRSAHRYQFQTFTGFELCFLTSVQQQHSVELIVKYQNLSSSNFKHSNSGKFSSRQDRTSNLNSTIELKRNRFSKMDCTFALTDDLDIDDICDMVMNSHLEQCNEEQESKCRPSSPKRLSKFQREGTNPKSINGADNLNDSDGGFGGSSGRDSIQINCTVKSFRQSTNISNPSSSLSASSGSSSSQSSSSWLYRSYVKLAERLNRLREMAAETNNPGPNVMIIGPCDSGKSSLAKMLVNYATGDGYSPIYVDLDVGQGSIGVPGMIGAGIVDQQSSIDQDTFQYRSNSSIIVHFGSVTPGNDPLLHRLSVGCLERNISNLIQQDQSEYQKYQRSSKDENSKKMLTKWSGLVVNTHGWTFDYGYESTLDAAKQFNISHICVLGDYRLFDRIYRDLNNGQVPGGGGQSSSRDNRRGTWNRRNQTNSSRDNSQRSSSQADNSIEILFFQPNLSTIKRSNRLRRKLRFNRFVNYFSSPRSLVDLDNNPDRMMTTVQVPFGEHSIFRFYLKSDCKFLNLLNGESDPTMLARKPSEIVYLTLKLRKTKRKLNDEAIFYHLDPEVLVYLRNRILSIMEISSKKLLSKSCVDQRSSSLSDSHFYWFSLRELLTVRGLARITQVDMENEQLEIQLPYRFSELLKEQKLVFLLNETNFDEDDEEFC